MPNRRATYENPLNSRHPFQIVFLVFSVISGITILATGNLPASIAEALPTAFHQAWAVGLIVGPLTTLIGIFMVKVTGLRVEAAGLSFTGFISLLYATCVFVARPETGIATLSAYAAFAIACYWQVFRIFGSLKLYEAAMQQRRFSDRDGQRSIQEFEYREKRKQTPQVEEERRHEVD